jgi:predicted metalloprotease
MRLGNRDRSNVEDRRGLGGMGIRLGVGGTLLLAVLSLVFGTDLLSGTVDPGGGAPPGATGVEERKATEAELEEVAVASFNDAQEVWGRALGERWRPARLVLFWDGTRSGCGDASAAMGPFYCPQDERVYVDLGFYRELTSRFGAAGEAAQAYVIAHEVAHHAQHVLGVAPRVREAQARDPEARNELSVRLELQADCFAGAWAGTVGERGLLDPGDVDDALRAAAAVGDDRIQEATTGRVQPERFTHGTAEQRAGWFRRGFDARSPQACDTFEGDDAIAGEPPAPRGAPGRRR